MLELYLSSSGEEEMIVTVDECKFYFCCGRKEYKSILKAKKLYLNPSITFPVKIIIYEDFGKQEAVKTITKVLQCPLRIQHLTLFLWRLSVLFEYAKG